MSQQHDLGTVRGQFEVLFRPQCLRFKAARTAYRYRLEIDRLEKFLKRTATLADLNDMTVGDCGEWMPSPKGLKLSVESTRGFIGRIRKLWDFLARKRVAGIVEFPTIENLRKQRRIPVAWNRDELSQLWECLLHQPGMIGEVPARDWYCSIHVTIWRTSERIGAMLLVRPQDVDLSGGWLTIPGEFRKGGRQGRVYKLTPDCIEWISKIYDPHRERVWEWPFSYHLLWVKYKQLLKDAGLPYSRDRMWHCLRKSHASHLESLGGDATQSLGHKNRETTADYLDEKIVRREWAGQRLFGLDGAAPARQDNGHVGRHSEESRTTDSSSRAANGRVAGEDR